ncbi:hypothetical protein ACNAW0_19515 [Micromonospora sp. SL1-18]|uniref:hypothetical protein n=1 Tax=Micromonospora sp. SL1-18 TaxID=3399128 RepID=UPI003A4DF544
MTRRSHDADGGTIAAGKRNDPAVLDRNLFAAGAGLPADARITHTIAGGSAIYEGGAGLSR